MTIQDLAAAIESPEASPADLTLLTVPLSYRAAVLRDEDTRMFEGVPLEQRQPARSIHVQEVPTPEPGPVAVVVAVMASAVN